MSGNKTNISSCFARGFVIVVLIIISVLWCAYCASVARSCVTIHTWSRCWHERDVHYVVQYNNMSIGYRGLDSSGFRSRSGACAGGMDFKHDTIKYIIRKKLFCPICTLGLLIFDTIYKKNRFKNVLSSEDENFLWKSFAFWIFCMKLSFYT